MNTEDRHVQELYNRRNQLVRCLVSARKRFEDGEIEVEDMRALERAVKEAQEDIDRIEHPERSGEWAIIP